MKERFVFGSPQRSSGRRLLLVVTVAALIIVALDLGTHGTVRSYVRGLAAHISTSGTIGAGAVADTGFFSTHSRLAHENAALKAQIDQYQDRISENIVLRDQNDQLRALVDLTAAQPGLTAEVVSTYLASPYGTFLINTKARDVATGDLVLSGGGFVLGRIANVGATSIVRQIFASDSSIEGLIAGSATQIDGYGGGNARAALSRDVKVTVGDLVLAPSLGGRPVGIVGSIESSAASANQKIYIRLPVNLSSIRYVYVVSSH